MMIKKTKWRLTFLLPFAGGSWHFGECHRIVYFSWFQGTVSGKLSRDSKALDVLGGFWVSDVKSKLIFNVHDLVLLVLTTKIKNTHTHISTGLPKRNKRTSQHETCLASRDPVANPLNLRCDLNKTTEKGHIFSRKDILPDNCGSSSKSWPMLGIDRSKRAAVGVSQKYQMTIAASWKVLQRFCWISLLAATA